MSFSKKEEAIKEGIESFKLLPTDHMNEHWNAEKMMSEEMQYRLANENCNNFNDKTMRHNDFRISTLDVEICKETYPCEM